MRDCEICYERPALRWLPLSNLGGVWACARCPTTVGRLVMGKFQVGRGESGRLRNFRAMNDEKFNVVYRVVKRAGDDGEAIIAVETEYARRYPGETRGSCSSPSPHGGQACGYDRSHAGPHRFEEHEFATQSGWHGFYRSLSDAAESALAVCVNCGSAAGAHRDEAPPLCPPYRGDGRDDPNHTSFRTKNYRSARPQYTSLVNLLDELLAP